MDEELRELERAWLTTRDPAAGERLRAALVRTGALEPEDPLEGEVKGWVDAPGEVLHTRTLELLEALLADLGAPLVGATETVASRAAEGPWGGWVTTTTRSDGSRTLVLERTEEPKTPGDSQDRSTEVRVTGLPGGVTLSAIASGGCGDVFLGFGLAGPARALRLVEGRLGRLLARRALAGVGWRTDELPCQPAEWRARAAALLDRARAPRGAPHGWFVIEDGPERLGIELEHRQLAPLGPLPRRLHRLSLEVRAYRRSGRSEQDPEHQELFLALAGHALDLEEGKATWGRFGGGGWLGFHSAMRDSTRLWRRVSLQHPERLHGRLWWAWDEGRTCAQTTIHARLTGEPDEVAAAGERLRALGDRWSAELR